MKNDKVVLKPYKVVLAISATKTIFVTALNKTNAEQVALMQNHDALYTESVEEVREGTTCKSPEQ